NVIIFSLLAAAPLALVLPYVGPLLAIIFLALLGVIVMSSFSVAVAYAQELMTGNIVMVSGLIVDLALGMGGIGSVALGSMIDWVGLTPTMVTISLLPLLGLLSYMLPTDEKINEWYSN